MIPLPEVRPTDNRADETLVAHGPLQGIAGSETNPLKMRLEIDPRARACFVALVVVAAALAPNLPASAKKPGPVPCKNGHAGAYPCKGIDLQSYVPNTEMSSARIADVWGWADPETKKEYALLGSTRGVQFLDVTDPTKPVYLGSLLGKPETVLIWQEIEIYKDHAFVVCDLSPCGLQIFDLTRLRGAEAAQPWTPDVVVPIGTAHSIDLNPDTGFLYVNGGLFPVGTPYIFDVNTPKAPVPAGGTFDDGYTHDSFCRTYKGPDKDFKKKEICFNFNEDTITVYDMTNKLAPDQLARVTYDNASYIHSGVLTKDHAYLLSTDEGDEQDHGLRSTTYIWDVRKLTKMKLIGTYTANSGAIDHNLYQDGDATFHASYVAGLRILDSSRAAQGKLSEVAYFDIVPESDRPEFDGTWAAYPFLPSGNVLIGGMGQGLFVVRPDPAILKRLK